MQIPYEQLSDEALRGVIEEFINREGADYGSVEFSLDEKVEQVRGQLRSGEVVLLFDADSETCNLIRREQWRDAEDGEC